MKELTGAPRDVAVSVFGGILNDGSSVTANSDATELTVYCKISPIQPNECRRFYRN